MKEIHNIEEWQLVVPLGYENFKDKLSSYLPKANDISILIVDDIDADGFGSAKIAKSKLSKIFPNCEVYINDKHGFTDIEKGKRYDIVFIVDSSSNLLQTYSDLRQVFILDHHEYDHTQICPDNVCFINSKDTEQLKSISAGMLTYLVLTKFLEDIGQSDDSLFDVACMTLYSDVVPVDDYVQSCLYKFLSMDTYSDVITSLNIYRDTINHNTLAFTVIPLINYTRRLGDVVTLKMLYGDNEELAVRSLLDNKDKSRQLLDIIDRLGTEGYNGKTFRNFVYWDISFIVNNLPQYKVANFKGVHANKLMDRLEKPALVGYVEDSVAYFSVRSNHINSLEYFQGESIDGGGHKSACGFNVHVDLLEPLLTGYDDYLKVAESEQEHYIILHSITDLDLFSLTTVAIINEFRFSNYRPIKFLLKNVDAEKQLENIDSVRGRFSIHKYNFISYKQIVDTGVIDIEIVPVLSSMKIGSKKLIANIKEVQVQDGRKR